MDKLLDKEVHQLFKPSPNDLKMSNYVVLIVSSCSENSVAESASATDAADEGLVGNCQEKLKPVAAGSSCGKIKSKSSPGLRYICIYLHVGIFCYVGSGDFVCVRKLSLVVGPS